MELIDKSIMLIGATGGIGSVLCQKLSSEQAHLILLGRKIRGVKKLVTQGHEFYEIDIRDRKQIEAFHKTVHNRKIDIIIDVAGIGLYKSLEEITESDWDDSFIVNVTAPFLFIKYFLKSLQKNPSSLVLTVGSGAGVIPMKGRSVYCASKFALRGFMLSLAEEFAGRFLRFCLITLGSTLTNFAGVPVEKKYEEFKKGRAYFTPEWVSGKLVEIMKLDRPEVEYTLYPGDFGFGYWKTP